MENQKSREFQYRNLSVLNYVFRVPLCPTCLTWLRAVRAHVPYVPVS